MLGRAIAEYRKSRSGLDFGWDTIRTVAIGISGLLLPRMHQEKRKRYQYCTTKFSNKSEDRSAVLPVDPIPLKQ